MSKLYIPLNIQRFKVSFTISCSTLSQSVENNTSTVRITCKVKRTGGSTYWEKPNYRTLTIRCDGQSTTQSTQFKSGSVGQEASWYSDFTVSHNNDGTKYIEYSGSIPATGSLDALSASGNANLTTIPRQPNYNSISASSIQETSVRLTASIDTHGLGITAGGWDLSDNGGASWTYYDGYTTDRTITGLTPGKQYWYRGYCATAGGGSNSSWQSFTTYEYPHCTVASDFTIGNNVTLQFYNPLNRNVELQMWSHVSQGFINTTRISATPGHNQNYTFPASSYVNNLYQSIPNITESKYNIDVWYSGNKAVKEAGKYSVNVSNCKPTFNLFTWEDINATTLALTGSSSTVVKNKSNIQVTISVANKAVAQNYATITNYEFKCNNVTCLDPMTYSEESSVTGTINGVTSNSFEVRAVDSRGIPSDYVTLVAQDYILYESLTKGNASISRTNGVSEETSLTFAGKITLVDFGDVDNDLTSVTYQYKKSSDATYTPGETTITPTIDQNGNFTFTGLIEGDEDDGFDVSNVYLVQVIVQDELSSITYDLTLGSGIPHIAYHKNGVSIMGKYNPEAGGLLQVAGVPIQGGGGITGDTVPIGAIMPYSSSYIPENWLECNGQAVSRTDYADLFQRIGTTFGAGNGSTTFNVPNFNTRVPVGYDSTDTDFNAIGKTGGSKTHHHSYGFKTNGWYGTLTENFWLWRGTDNQWISSLNYGSSGDLHVSRGGTDTANSQAQYMEQTTETSDTNALLPYITTKYIIKAFQSAGVIANVSNTYSTSQSDTYSCNYVNNITNSPVLKDLVVNSKSGITNASITFKNYWGFILVVTTYRMGIIHFVGQGNQPEIINIKDSLSEMQFSWSGNSLNISGLYTWENYLFVGNHQIKTITTNLD